MNPPTDCAPDAAPANVLWVQLVTRIATQPLHYRSGEEERAAWSLFLLFDKTRELLAAHRDAAQFRTIAVSLLNDTLRPYTARWHGWMTEDKERRDKDGKPLSCFRDEQVRRQFRAELKELQPKLREACGQLANLAGIVEPACPATVSDGTHAQLGASLVAGIEEQVQIKTSTAGDRTLVQPADINAAERQTLLERRRILAGAAKPEAILTDAAGLALSGGGIRSATFCLGILQVLVRRKLFPQFDYLSTVSGGGYIGSFLSCALGTEAGGSPSPATRQSVEERIASVFHRKEETSRQKSVESGLLRHLRNNSKYLLGGGFTGKASILGLLISGVLWNVMMILPIPLAAALLAYVAGPWLWGGADVATIPLWPKLMASPSGWVLIGVSGAFALSWLALPGIQLLTHGKPPRSRPAMWRSRWEELVLWLGLGAAGAAAIYLVPALFNGHEWLRNCLDSTNPNYPGDSWKDVKARILELVPASAAALAGTALAAASRWLGPKWPRLRALAVKLFILTGPVLFLFVFLLVGNRLGIVRDGEAVWSFWGVFATTVLLALWDSLCVNINTLAPHRFYRGRLCDCYLARRVAPDAAPASPREQALSGEPVQGSVQVLKQVPLTSLGKHPAAPYHLVNMALNVPTSKDKNLRGRGCDFFIASRHFYGSPLTGYARTEELERVDSHFDLGTAMAVSAAAASTSMGWQSVPHFRFLMALFNVRLGYWIRRPGVSAKGWVTEGAGPLYLLREMVGSMSEQCRYVNLSDGGHIENLAAYELLRRKCKFIVCVDAGHEPGMECSDLMRLQRYAEIDLGLRMHFDIADLQIGPNGLSRAHAILVKIDYAPEQAAHAAGRGTSDELGWMLYLKLAMTGVEPNHVDDYRRQHGEFPHQSTGDQIFEEEQFEAYRALGECAMDGLFRGEIVGAKPPASVRDWFQSLANNLLPDNDKVFLSSQPKRP